MISSCCWKLISSKVRSVLPSHIHPLLLFLFYSLIWMIKILKVYHAIHNLPKSKAALTSARTVSTSIYVVPLILAEVDDDVNMMSTWSECVYVYIWVYVCVDGLPLRYIVLRREGFQHFLLVLPRRVWDLPPDERGGRSGGKGCWGWEYIHLCVWYHQWDTHPQHPKHHHSLLYIFIFFVVWIVLQIHAADQDIEWSIWGHPLFAGL